MRAARQLCSATVFFLVAAASGCKQPAAVDEDDATELAKPLVSIDTETEADVESLVAAAVAADRAIIFIHLDWAFMEPQRTRFADFAKHFPETDPSGKVLFQYVDCTPVTTGYRPLRSLNGWVELERAGGRQSLIQGWGELAWLQHGRVLHVQRIQDFETTSDLIKKTKSLFGKKSSG